MKIVAAYRRVSHLLADCLETGIQCDARALPGSAFTNYLAMYLYLIVGRRLCTGTTHVSNWCVLMFVQRWYACFTALLLTASQSCCWSQELLVQLSNNSPRHSQQQTLDFVVVYLLKSSAIYNHYVVSHAVYVQWFRLSSSPVWFCEVRECLRLPCSLLPNSPLFTLLDLSASALLRYWLCLWRHQLVSRLVVKSQVDTSSSVGLFSAICLLFFSYYDQSSYTSVSRYCWLPISDVNSD